MCRATIASIITHCMAVGLVKTCRCRNPMPWSGHASENAVEDALIVLILTHAPGGQGSLMKTYEDGNHFHALRPQRMPLRTRWE